MRIGITSIGFLGYDMTRVVPFLKGLGYDGLELIYYRESWRSHVPSPEKLLRSCRESGLDICAFRFIAGTGGESEGTPGELFDLAAFFRVPVVDVKIESPEETDATEADRESAAALLAALADEAEGRGMRLVVETHPGVVHSSVAATLRLIEISGRKDVAVNYDQANLDMAGKEPADTALALLEGRIGYVHLKNGWFPEGGPVWTPIRYGRIDTLRIIRRLLTGGYTGYVTVEKPGGGEPFTWARADIEYLRELEELVEAM